MGQIAGRDLHVIATVRGKSPALDPLKARFPTSLEDETVDIVDEDSVRAVQDGLEGLSDLIVEFDAPLAVAGLR